MAKAVSNVLREQFPHLYPKEADDARGTTSPTGQGEGASGRPTSANAGARPNSSYGSGAYVQRKRVIDAQYNAKISAAEQAEAYLDEAARAARQAEAEALAEADRLYTVNHRKTGIPKGANPLRLDTKRLDNLLDPTPLVKETIADFQKTLAPPVTLDFRDTVRPNYLRSTASQTDRSKTLARTSRTSGAIQLSNRLAGHVQLMTEEQRQIEAAAHKRRQLMANTMPIAQKAKEEEDLRIMKGKLDFLRNPRHAAEHLSTFRQIFGRTMPIAVNERPVSLPPVPAKSNLTSKPNVYFSVEPSEVVFRDYEVGGVYEMGLAFRNLSSISRRIRVLPPASRFFSITTAKFPTADGLLAPGMSCQVSVRFAPDSLADYEDALTVVTELDRFPVALAGRRPPPSLTLRPALDCGYVLVGNHCLSKFSFENLGGAGRFRMVADRDWPEALSPLADDGSLALGAFQLFPAEFEMAPGAQQVLYARFSPARAGEETQVFHLVCDNCQVKRFTIAAQGVELAVSIPTLDGRKLGPGELASDPVWFGAVVYGTAAARSLTLSNATPVPLPFRFRSRRLPADGGAGDSGPASSLSARPAAADADAADGQPGRVFNGQQEGDGAAAGPQRDDGEWEDADGSVFTLDPWHGTFPSRGETPLTVTFTPECLGRVLHEARLEVDTALPESADRRWVSVADLSFEGLGVPPEVELEPPLLQFAGSLLPTVPAHRDVLVANRSAAPVRFHWEGCGAVLPGGGLVAVDPVEGEIPPGETRACRVLLEAAEVGPAEAELACVLEHGPRLPLFARAEAVGPRVAALQPGIEFGLVQVACAETRTLTLRNEQDVPVSWSLADSSGGELALSADRGALQPWEAVDVQVTFVPSRPGAFLARLTASAGGPPTEVEVRASALAPAAALDRSRVDLGDSFLRVPVERLLRLRNLTQLPAAFRWQPEVLGVAPGALAVEIRPEEGALAPGEVIDVSARFTPLAVGAWAGVVACDVAGAARPIGFEVATEIKGLELEFAVRRSADGAAVSGGPEGGVDGDVVLDFGRFCPLGQRVTLELEVRNLTSITCDIACGVSCFPGAVGGELMVEPSATVSALPADGGDGAGPPSGPLATEWSRRGHSSEDRRSRRAAAAAAERQQSTAAGSQRPSVSAGGMSATGRLTRGKVTEVVKRVQAIRLPPSGELAQSFARSAGVSVLTAKRHAAQEDEALAAGRGLALDISASTWTLLPFATWRCEITAHSNAPGVYDDVFSIRVGPLPLRHIPLRVGVVGSPLEAHVERRRTLGAPPAAHCHARSLPTLRFGTVPAGSERLARTFHVTNTSPYPMRVAWAAHSYLSEGAAAAEAEAEGGGGRLVSASAREHGTGVRLSVLPRTVPEGAPYSVLPESAVIPPKATLPFTCAFDPSADGPHDAVLIGSHEFAVPGSGAPGADEAEWRDLRLVLRDASARWGDSPGAALAAAVSGGFHTFAAAPAVPMPPLRVAVEGNAVASRLEVENRGKLRFKCSTAHDPAAHPSFRRVVTLTNSSLTPLSCSLDTSAPFALAAVEPSVPQLPFGATPLTARVFTVPPRETLDATLVLQLPPTEHPRLLDYALDGLLFISFTTGAVQTFPLLADVYHPEVAADPAALEFGRVHCANPRVLRVELSNATQADAEWAAEVEGEGGDGAFAVVPPRGVLPGRGMGHPTTSTVEIRFAPPAAGRFEADVVVSVKNGRGCVVAVQGEGTFDEAAEAALHLKGVQSPRRMIAEAEAAKVAAARAAERAAESAAREAAEAEATRAAAAEAAAGAAQGGGGAEHHAEAGATSPPPAAAGAKAKPAAADAKSPSPTKK